MKQLPYLVLLITLCFNCSKQKKISEQLHTNEIKIEQISKNIYQHISYLETEDYGKVACNGMIYIKNKEAIIYDTPTNQAAAIQLINWIQLVHSSEIKAVVVTHFHEDCLGSLQSFHDIDTPTYASNQTLSLIDQSVNELPKIGFDNVLELQIGHEKAYAKFFGEGHTKDNVVGYIPSEKALFGGCLIKSIDAKKGNLADANINEWSHTVKQVKNEYPNLEYVIPGHGKPGNAQLLDYTINLFLKQK